MRKIHRIIKGITTQFSTSRSLLTSSGGYDSSFATITDLCKKIFGEHGTHVFEKFIDTLSFEDIINPDRDKIDARNSLLLTIGAQINLKVSYRPPKFFIKSRSCFNYSCGIEIMVRSKSSDQLCIAPARRKRNSIYKLGLFIFDHLNLEIEAFLWMRNCLKR